MALEAKRPRMVRGEQPIEGGFLWLWIEGKRYLAADVADLVVRYALPDRPPIERYDRRAAMSDTDRARMTGLMLGVR